MSLHAPDAAFALALLRLKGVGRAAAGRLLSAFADAEAARASPREQVLVRLKRIPHADSIAESVQSGDVLPSLLSKAEQVLRVLGDRQVSVLTARHPDWPSGLEALGWSQRPPALWCYGNSAALRAPAVAALAAPADRPLSERAFAMAEALPRLLPSGAAVVSGAETGFDVAMVKRAGAGSAYSVMVAGCGLARLAAPFRPVAQAAVRAGGALISPFDMEHGPYPHDAREQALVQAALADATVAYEPEPDGPVWSALAWAKEHGKSAFCFGEGPDGVERLDESDGLERLRVALGG